ncbi:putative lysosomal acid phosphatase [Monocercomonoides exilis]|uniref:putative lysosomal acid phosphatase n=1 Tax=Monocercomonoides exilis TaxID=2049356 RepID=UPI003559E1D9|nr:putative lysosomal acid phosphatase [Monocercomonoides exilis]|eukprot:MONOS_3361.1-p1 / transcript=MONOS_3361.1 / gene=MONOS_3361 / organism=Monocercomonoides_exilis_PA203 / gene_product=lysosomal acid phosphatase / transcript_product=lysosomal acid phosphatase / location=Mono_scaffold00078:113669-115555(+) / protein_length=505 / sequence_SO=supercontig / SO=protein_coding / is_pseudo=false
MICAIYILVIAFGSAISSSDEKLINEDPQLIQLFAITRHGARAPNKSIPNLKCKEFTVAKGELTSLGQKQHYDLGMQLRDEYPFLPTEYDSKKFYFKSSDENRSLMSAEAHLQGLFKSSYKQDPPSLGLPIHSESTDNDWVIQGRKSCKGQIQKLLDPVKLSEEYLKKEKENADILATLAKEAGYIALTIDNVSYVADQIFCANAHNYKKCMFQNDTLNQKAMELNAFSNKMEHRIEDKEAAQLLISTFLDDVFDRIEETLSSESYSYVLYSAHDGNILSLLQLFNQPSPGNVPYASLFYFELYHLHPQTMKRPFSGSDVGIKIGYRPFKENDADYDDYHTPFNATSMSSSASNPNDRSDASHFDFAEYARHHRSSSQFQSLRSQRGGWRDFDGRGRVADKAKSDFTKEVCKKDYCSLEDLKKLVITKEQWKNKCFPKEKEKEPPKEEFAFKKSVVFALIVVTAVVFVGFVICLVVSIVFGFKLRKKNRYSSINSLESSQLIEK